MRKWLRAFTLLELMIVVSIVGILAAIAIPMFLHFQGRAMQSEVKANLRTIYITQEAYSLEHDSFTGSFSSIGFSPERGNRYSYVLETPARYWPRNTAALANPTTAMNAIEVDTFKFSSHPAQPATAFAPSVLNGGTPSFTTIGVGSIEAAGPLDEWSISSNSRDASSASSDTTCGSGNNASGEPCHDQGPF